MPANFNMAAAPRPDLAVIAAPAAMQWSLNQT
jgi:hypothetical protein